jgi:hypothetical protein
MARDGDRVGMAVVLVLESAERMLDTTSGDDRG